MTYIKLYLLLGGHLLHSAKINLTFDKKVGGRYSSSKEVSFANFSAIRGPSVPRTSG